MRASSSVTWTRPGGARRRESVGMLTEPTGRPVTMSGQEVLRAVDGRFVEVWHLEDVGALMRYRKERSRN